MGQGVRVTNTFITLEGLIASIADADSDHTIYASEPWNAQSQATPLDGVEVEAGRVEVPAGFSLYRRHLPALRRPREPVRSGMGEDVPPGGSVAHSSASGCQSSA
jgi:hypothetical protein